MAENDAKCKSVFPKEEGEEDVLKCLRGVKKTRKY